MSDIVLISGIPGAGKTTVSKKIAELCIKSAHINSDQLRFFVVGGFKNPSETWDADTTRQYYLSFKNAAALAKNFLDEGYKVVIDDVVHTGDHYPEWERYFGKFNPKKVLLFPNLKKTLERNKSRVTQSVPEEVIKKLYKEFSEYDFSDWTVLDTGSESEDITASKIINILGW